MILWRISNYADLLGIGALYASARWHTAGQPVVYLAESPSSALLEVFVHLETDEEHRPDSYQLLKVEADDTVPFETVDLASLSPAWMSNELETQSRGDAWLARKQTALLRVPSAITPETWELGSKLSACRCWQNTNYSGSDALVRHSTFPAVCPEVIVV